MTIHSYYTANQASPIPLNELTGKLFVLEGSEGSGRAAQIELLQNAIERLGYPVLSVNVMRSTPLAVDLISRLNSVHICARTLSLVYATALIDQMEREVLPALKSGTIVLMNGYVHRFMAKSLMLGASYEWLQSLYGIALKSNATIYLKVPPEVLAPRIFSLRAQHEEWSYSHVFERSQNVYRSLIDDQTKFDAAFHLLEEPFSFTEVNGEKDVDVLHHEIFSLVSSLL